MTGFFFKKAFFDGWDNFFPLMLMNLGYVLLVLAVLGVISLVLPAWAYLLAFAALGLVFSVYTGGVSGMANRISRYSKENFKYFRQCVRRNLRHSVLHFLCIAVIVLGVSEIMPYYLQILPNTFGVILAGLVFWVVFFLAVALQYYFPLANLMPDDSPRKTLKKCFIVMFGNPGFSIFLFFYGVIDFALSVVLAFMIPGLAGVNLAYDVALKILMFKIDYLDANPDLDARERRHIPWDDLLFDEKEKVGHRSLRNMIFPWKE